MLLKKCSLEMKKKKIPMIFYAVFIEFIRQFVRKFKSVQRMAFKPAFLKTIDRFGKYF